MCGVQKVTTRLAFCAMVWHGGFRLNQEEGTVLVTCRKKSVNVLIVSCASTKDGEVATLLGEVRAKCEAMRKGQQFGIQVRVTHLMDIPFKLEPPRPHYIPDYACDFVEDLRWADVVLWGTPVRWWLPSEYFTILMRCVAALEYDRNFPLKGKTAGFFTNGDTDGGMKVALDMLGPLSHFGFAFEPHAIYFRNQHLVDHSEGDWMKYDHTEVTTYNAIMQAALYAGLIRGPVEWH